MRPLSEKGEGITNLHQAPAPYLLFLLGFSSHCWASPVYLGFAFIFLIFF